MCFYEDEGGVMWIGTYKKSVAYYDEGILSSASTTWEILTVWKKVMTVRCGWVPMTPG